MEDTTTQKQYLHTALLALLWIVPQLAYANDCLTSTNPPHIIGNFPGIVDEKLDSDNGVYLASLENGDQLMAHFAQCGLALRGHYLLRSEHSEEDRKAKITLFLSRILPSQHGADKVVAQFETRQETDFKEGVILQGQNDEHKLTISAAKSPLFSHEVHYEWLPPQH